MNKEVVLKKVLFRNERLMALSVKDNGYQVFDLNGEKHYINVEIALFKIIRYVFDKYGIYLSIQLGEDSLDAKWWTCDFKYKGELKSFYSDKNYEAVESALLWIEENSDV